MTRRYDTEACRSLRQYLRAHIKAKYGPVKTAAFKLCISADSIHCALNGHMLPNKRLLDDAGVEMVKTIQWEVTK